MGYRAHVCTRYEVKYDIGVLKNNAEAIEKLLSERTYLDDKNYEHPILNWVSENGESMEIDPQGLQQLVNDIENEEVCLADYGIENDDVEEVADTFVRWLNIYDKTNDFIRVEWF